MKPTFKSLPFRTSFLITVAVCPVFLATGLEAATWVGNTDANLANGLNWDSAPAAPASGEAWVFGAAGTSGAALTNNLATTSAFEVAGITFGAASSAYTITGGAFSLTGNIAATSASAVNLGSNITVSDARQVNLNGSSNITLSGSLSGAGSLTQTAGGTGAKTLFLTGDNSGFTGTFTQTNDSNNRTGFNSPTAGSTAADWVLNRNVAGGVAINLATTDVLHLGSLSGTGSIRGSGILSVGAKNTSTTWGGTLASNTGTVTLGLTKVGTGTLTMSNTNRHTLATTVNAGVLNITGAMENSPVTVNNGATFQVGGSGKKLQSLAINAGGTAKVGSVTSVTGAVAATGQGSVLDLVNGTTGSMLVDGAGGLTLGGPNPTDTASVKLEAGGLVPDSIDVFNGLAVDQGGAAITITNLGVSAGETYPILSFASGSGAGFATGTGVTVGSLTLANPNLSFGISGQLEVTATGVNLVTTGATPPGSAYWSGTQGAQWSSTSGSNANFTTGATGSTFLNVLPGANTMVYFSHNSPTNLTNTLGANFDIYGLTYRGTSAAVATSGAQTLTLEDGGITVESGNGGATLSMDSIVLAQDQIWSNESANPLVVSAAGVTGPSSFLTMEGDGGVQLGGATFSVDTLEVATDLNLNGTAVTANLWDSPGAITNDASSNAVLTAANHQNATLSGEISDEGPGSLLQLVKTSTGTLTLSGNNIYEGGTTLAGGTLAAGSDEAFGLGVVAITSPAATLDLNGHLLPNDLTNSGTGATITNSSAVEATVEAGFNLAGAAGFVISDFTVNGTGNIRWDGAIRRTNGAGTMTKSGTNTLIINEDFFAAPMGGMNLLVAD